MAASMTTSRPITRVEFACDCPSAPMITRLIFSLAEVIRAIQEKSDQLDGAGDAHNRISGLADAARIMADQLRSRLLTEWPPGSESADDTDPEGRNVVELR